LGAALAVPLTAVGGVSSPADALPAEVATAIVVDHTSGSDQGAPSAAPAGRDHTVFVAGCMAALPGEVGQVPSVLSPGGVQGTTTDDLAAFAQAFNNERMSHCLRPIPLVNFRYDACMEARLFWMAEDPSTDPVSAWGHIGTVRSDGVPSVGCDGNLAGGMNNTSETVVRKWWDSTAHRTALFKPGFTGSTSSVCIYFAMTHGGVPDEPYAFVRAAARWGSC
jgi:hypothetical protein